MMEIWSWRNKNVKSFAVGKEWYESVLMNCCELQRVIIPVRRCEGVTVKYKSSADSAGLFAWELFFEM